MHNEPLIDELVEVQANASLLHTAVQVQEALDMMAAAVRERLASKRPLLLCVLTGGVMTTTWLAERLGFPLQIDYVHVSRYHGKTRASEQLHWLTEPHVNLQGRHVLLVDDIYDEGITMSRLVEYCWSKGAAQVTSAVLVRKRHTRNRGGMEPDIAGLEVGDRFVFGCGLDYRNYLRNLPGIYAVSNQENDK